ncbi:MAG: thioether cross-link-forming SCIFF peptide maturase [Eubacterium sp.]|nr:thioether cross-link-forming SCIFF peptide maturase [Eubacterium sp.]
MQRLHLYKNNGYSIVLDINSGSVHLVDDMTYDLLDLLDRGLTESEASDQLSASYDRKELEECLEEIGELKEAGVLFTDDIYEEKIDQFSHRPTVVKALCLHIAHDCNLACRYCFAEEGEYHGRRALMSYEVGKKALDFLVKNSGNRRNLEVDFFGGEPTMNWQVVKDLVAYGRSLEEPNDKKFRFTLTTNGVLLNDEIMDFCNKEMGNVVLSVDGRKEVHDHMRPFRSGKGSYDLVIPKFQKFAESRHQDKYYVRGTFTHYNLDFAKDVLNLADLGFKQISIEPVVAPPEEDYAIRKEDLPIIMDQYDILAKEMIKREKEGRGFNFFHFMIDLTGGPCVYKRLSGCGSGGEYLAVTPWGDLYPCHQFVGNEKFLLGDVDHGVVRPDLVEEFKKVNVYSKPECASCFARFYCSGGCAANSYNFTGRINDVYEIGCAMQRKRTECALMIKAALADEDTDLFHVEDGCPEDCAEREICS